MGFFKCSRIFLFLFILVIALGNTATWGEEVEEENLNFENETIEETEKEIPYAGACFLNYGFSVGIKGGLRQTHIKGFASFNTGQTNGNEVDLLDDLDLNPFSNNYMIAFQMHLYGFRFAFDYSSAEFTGNTNLTTNTTILDTVYEANTSLKSKAEIRWYRFMIGYIVYANQYFGIGPSLRIDAIEQSYSFRGVQSDNIISEKEHITVPVAYPGIQIDFSFANSFVCTFSFYGLYFKATEIHVENAYVSLEPRWYLCENFYIFGECAYEYLKIKSETNNDVSGRIIFHSFFANVGFGLNF